VRRARGSELALVALVSAAFATASPLAKAAHGLPFSVLASGRCAMAAAGLLAAAPLATARAVAALPARGRLALGAAGLLLAGHFALFLGGLLATSLPAAAALVSLEPLAVVLAAWFAFGERPTARQWAGLLVATAGAVVVAGGAGHGEHRLAGDALVLASVVLFGAYVAMARALRDAMPMTPYAASVYGVAAIALAPLVLLVPPPPVREVPAASWAACAALGLVPTLVGHTLLQRAARRVPAAIVALASPGETVGAIVIGACVGRAPQGIEWAGAALVVAGVVVAVTGTRGLPGADAGGT
jgi:drug/metabolite transporter (DMT)-like permease